MVSPRRASDSGPLTGHGLSATVTAKAVARDGRPVIRPTRDSTILRITRPENRRSLTRQLRVAPQALLVVHLRDCSLNAPEQPA